ncbi:unnamed protein product [Echinostoma caproni]|uniref:Peptidase A2 domain-containing protein n=1 Tax=Echinostoma caproni TaxID=27848 RepID=A0A183A1P4_9TREM|nr:unnamed protein product [Echinostoma caproni]
MTLLSSVIAGGFVHTHSAPTIPAPDKFCLGDDFSLWVADAKNYVDLFLPAERRRVLLSLLDTYASAIVIQDGILDDEITDDTFTQLRFALTFDVCVRALRRLVNVALPREIREEKVLHQIHVGVRNAGLIRKFHRYRPQTVQQAIDTAREEEQLDDVIRQYQVSAPSYAMAAGPSRTPQGYSRPPQPNPGPAGAYQRGRGRVPRWSTERGNCDYCRRFGTRARFCGHNDPSESQSVVPTVPICPFRDNALPTQSILIDVLLWGKKVQALVDTGAACSLVKSTAVPRHARSIPTPCRNLIAANGAQIETHGSVIASLQLGDLHVQQQSIVTPHLPWDVILGVDLLRSQGAVIDITRSHMTIGSEVIPFCKGGTSYFDPVVASAASRTATWSFETDIATREGFEKVLACSLGMTPTSDAQRPSSTTSIRETVVQSVVPHAAYPSITRSNSKK